MAVRSKVGLVKDGFMPGKPKKTRQGEGKNTKYAATSRNGKRKAYRGQGKQWQSTLRICSQYHSFIFMWKIGK